MYLVHSKFLEHYWSLYTMNNLYQGLRSWWTSSPESNKLASKVFHFPKDLFICMWHHFTTWFSLAYFIPIREDLFSPKPLSLELAAHHRAEFRRLGGESRYKNIFLLGKAIKWHSCSSHYKSNRGQLPCPTICLNKLAWLFVSQVPFDPCLILPALVTECLTFHCERRKIIKKHPNWETNKCL